MFQDTPYKGGEGSLSKVWGPLQQSSGDSKFRFLSGEQKRGWGRVSSEIQGDGIYSPERISEKEAKSSRNALYVLSFLMFLPLEF